VSIDKLAATVKAAPDKAERNAVALAWMRDRDAVVAALDVSDDEIRALLRASKMPDSEIRSIVGRVRSERDRQRTRLRAVQPDEIDVWPEIEGIPEVDMPAGYWLDTEGRVMTTKGSGEAAVPVVVAHRAMLIEGQRVDHEAGRVYVDIGWATPGNEWESRTVTAGTVADARSLVSLADAGAPVTSVNASDLVRFLASQAALLPSVPGVAVSRSGWSGRSAFVAGTVDLLDAGQRTVRVVAEGGAEQTAEAIHEGGTWEGWCDAIRPITGRPQVMVAVYAAVAAVMLRPLAMHESFAVHWWADSSKGKTSALWAAASVIGDPVPAGIVRRWHGTDTALERHAAFCDSLPTCLDETADIEAHRRETVARKVYEIVSGQGKGRGTRNGTERVTEYRTVLLSTGEAPMSSWCSQGGLLARLIEISGPPCATAEQSDALKAGLASHHGHLLPRVVERLARGDWEAMRRWHATATARWRQTAPADTVAGRLASTVALLEAAGAMCTALGVPGDHAETMAWVWESVKRQAVRGDEAGRALDHVLGLVSSHDKQFISPQRREVQGGIVYGEHRNDGSIDINKTELNGWLKSANFQIDTVIAMWVRRGWAEIPTSRPYVGGRKTTVVRLCLRDD